MAQVRPIEAVERRRFQRAAIKQAQFDLAIARVHLGATARWASDQPCVMLDAKLARRQDRAPYTCSRRQPFCGPCKARAVLREMRRKVST